MGKVKIGTCGYGFYDPGEGWKDEYESKLAAYSDAFAVGEINRTFYSLPQVSTTERWRREAVESFEFTLKAWQALTHPTSSPTWNDHRDGLTDDKQRALLICTFDCYGLVISINFDEPLVDQRNLQSGREKKSV